MSPAWPLLPESLYWSENKSALLLLDKEECVGASTRIAAKFSEGVTDMQGAEEWNQIKHVKRNIPTEQNKTFKTAQCTTQINFWVVGQSGK